MCVADTPGGAVSNELMYGVTERRRIIPVPKHSTGHVCNQLLRNPGEKQHPEIEELYQSIVIEKTRNETRPTEALGDPR